MLYATYFQNFLAVFCCIFENLFAKCRLYFTSRQRKLRNVCNILFLSQMNFKQNPTYGQVWNLITNLFFHEMFKFYALLKFSFLVTTNWINNLTAEEDKIKIKIILQIYFIFLILIYKNHSLDWISCTNYVLHTFYIICIFF